MTQLSSLEVHTEWYLTVIHCFHRLTILLFTGSSDDNTVSILRTAYSWHLNEHQGGPAWTPWQHRWHKESAPPPREPQLQLRSSKDNWRTEKSWCRRHGPSASSRRRPWCGTLIRGPLFLFRNPWFFSWCSPLQPYLSSLTLRELLYLGC